MADPIVREQVRRVVIAFNAGRHDDARRLCEEGLRRNPRDPSLNHLLAAVLFVKGDIAAARARVDTSLAVKADSAPVHLLAGRIARAAQDFDAALQHLRQAVTLAPNAEILGERARTFEAAGKRDDAREAWQAVLRTDPRSCEAALHLGRLLSQDGMLAEAAPMLERAARGDAPASTWFDLGVVRQDLRDLVGAAAAYRVVLEKRPDHAEAAVNLGIVLQDVGDMDAAMRAYRIAYRLRETTFGMIATSLSAAPHGRLWLDREALKHLLRS